LTLMMEKYRDNSRHDHENTKNHTSFLTLFGSLRHEKIGSCVECVLESCRKRTKKNSTLLFATQMLDASFTFLLSHLLQHQID
jgi:hypothetical protein